MDLVDLTDPDATRRFLVVNDDVMGGVSTSRIGHEGDALVFAGTLRLDHGGGFASMRGPIGSGSDPVARDLRAWLGIEIVFRGDGRRYKLTLRDGGGGEGVVHRAAFGTRPDETMTVRLPFEAFEAWRRGRRLLDAPPLERSAVLELGVLVSDKQAGHFRIDLLAMRAYREVDSAGER